MHRGGSPPRRRVRYGRRDDAARHHVVLRATEAPTEADRAFVPRTQRLRTRGREQPRGGRGGRRRAPYLREWPRGALRERELRGTRPFARGLVRLRHGNRHLEALRAVPTRGNVERDPGRDAPAARRPQRLCPRVRHPCAWRDQTYRDVRADATGETGEGTHLRVRKTHRVPRGRREGARPWGRGDAGTSRGAREADQGLRGSAIERGPASLRRFVPRPRRAEARRDGRRVLDAGREGGPQAAEDRGEVKRLTSFGAEGRRDPGRGSLVPWPLGRRPPPAGTSRRRFPGGRFLRRRGR